MYEENDELDVSEKSRDAAGPISNGLAAILVQWNLSG